MGQVDSVGNTLMEAKPPWRCGGGGAGDDPKPEGILFWNGIQPETRWRKPCCRPFNRAAVCNKTDRLLSASMEPEPCVPPPAAREGRD